MRNVAYVGFTPYHVLLALSLEDQERQGCERQERRSLLLLADEAGFLDTYPEIAAEVEETLRIVSLPTASRNRFPLAKRVIRVRGYGRIFSTLRRRREDLVVRVFNGLRLEAEHTARYVPTSGTLDFVEDGLDAYFPLNARRLNRREVLIRVPRDGLRPRSNADSITWLPYQRYYVLEPALFRGPHDDRLHQIDPDSFRRVLDALQRLVHLDVPPASIEALLLLDHSEQITDVAGYLARVREWSRHHGGRSALKAHPRERDRTLLEGIRSLDAVILPAALPAELCTAYLRPDCEISCGLTTFVLSSRLLLPGRSIRLSDRIPVERRATLMDFDPAVS